MKISLDITKSLEENASRYFEKAKKMKKKVVGAEEILEKMKKRQGKEQKKNFAEIEEKEKVQKLSSRKKNWYEKFRWFVSSEGFLVLGGRDATTNEIIIKKHTANGDIVFHTDMAGSPFFVVKKDSNPDKEIGEPTINETANATVSFSRAWRLGLTTNEVFYVMPEQVTKEANTGEFLTKGAFMIKGKTNYVKNEIDVSLGIFEGAVMAGPKLSIQKNCLDSVKITQGNDKASTIAKKIRSKIGGELDEIIRALPSGGMKVAVEHDRKKRR